MVLWIECHWRIGLVSSWARGLLTIQFRSRMRLRNTILQIDFDLLRFVSSRSWCIAHIFKSSSLLVSDFSSSFTETWRICIICVWIWFRKHLSLAFNFQFSLFTNRKGWCTLLIRWKVISGTKLFNISTKLQDPENF